MLYVTIIYKTGHCSLKYITHIKNCAVTQTFNNGTHRDLYIDVKLQMRQF